MWKTLSRMFCACFLPPLPRDGFFGSEPTWFRSLAGPPRNPRCLLPIGILSALCSFSSLLFNSYMVKQYHTPIRTCVACRETNEKRDLLRVVRDTEGILRYDPKGKISGRGAYVCAQASCILLARKQKKLERSLKVSSVPESVFAELNARAALTVPTPALNHPAPESDTTVLSAETTPAPGVSLDGVDMTAG